MDRRLVRRRVPWLVTALAVAFAGISWRLVEVQALSADRFDELGKAQRVRRVALAAERGTIFDRDGNELALSIPQQTVWANPSVVTDPTGYARQLGPLLHDQARGADPDLTRFQAELEARLGKEGAEFVYLARKIDDVAAAKVQALRLPGVHFVAEPERHYPSDLAASVLGLVGLDNEGLSGLELQYDDILSGEPGELVVERDPQGRDIPQGLRQVQPATPGSDLVLTIDHGLQFETERALAEAVDGFGALGGRAVVVDVATGDVVAMANVSARRDGPARADDHASRNRAVTDVYEPGSTNKVITVAGALEEGLVNPSTPFTVPDRLPVADHVFSDHDPHPTEEWAVRRILVESSNVGAILIGNMLGKHRLDAYLRRFGFGEPTGLRFPGEASGLLLHPDDWYATSSGTVPIGNGLAVTAMQMLDVFATIANDGVWRQPRLVRATVDHEGRRLDAPLGATRQVVSPRTAEQVREMLVGVVAEGTGSQASIPGYSVAGKTGTARKPLDGARGYSENYVASFVGFVPAEEPRLAGIVVLDEPTPIYGGVVAAPTFARIMKHALRLEGVAPDPVAPVGPRGHSVPAEPPGREEVAWGALHDLAG